MIERISGSEAVIRSLIQEGTNIVFGYPGGSIMPVYDALYDYQDRLKHVLTRHEQGAIHAAQGYARVTGRVGVCIATSGPGATNLVTGIADAMIDSTPLVCITGQVGAALLGTDAFQESDVIGITMPVTKWNCQITSAEEIAPKMAMAFYIARTGRPGPVVVDITKNAQFEMADFEYIPCTKIRSYVPEPPVSDEKVAEAANLINNAKKPLLLFGQGVILGSAEAELKTFIEKTGIPSAWTLLGASALDYAHPLNVGMLGMHGNYGPNIKTNECDVLIAVGMRFDDRVTGKVSEYATQAKVIHLEIDPSEVNKIIKADVAVMGNAKKSLKKLIEAVQPNTHEAWLNEFKECYKIEYDTVINNDIYPTKPGLTMAEVIRIISEKTENDAVMVTDVGQQQMFAGRYFNHKSHRSFVTSGGLGTMGFGLPAAVGAKFGRMDKHVVAIIGDGGFQMTLQEMGTISQEKLPVKIVILNNNFLGMVRQWQELFFDKRYSFTEMVNPNFVKLADAFGIDAQSVSVRDGLDTAIQTMLDHPGPYLLEVIIEKEDNVFPMVPSGASVSQIILEKPQPK